MPKHVSFSSDTYIPKNTEKCRVCKKRDISGNAITGKREMALCISCLKKVCYTTCFVYNHDVCLLCYYKYYDGILNPGGN